MNDGFSVELVGLPGSGKSVLCTRVRDILQEKNIEINHPPRGSIEENICLYGKVKQLIVMIPFALVNLRYTYRSACFILSRKERNEVHSLGLLQAWMLMSFLLWKNRRKKEVDLFSQALLQILWAIGFSSKEGYLLNLPDCFLKSVYLADLIVIVDADIATIEERLNARANQSYLEEWLPEDPLLLNKSLDVLEDLKRIIGKIVRDQKDVQVLSVDNGSNSNLEDNAIRIADMIEQCCKRNQTNMAEE